MLNQAIKTAEFEDNQKLNGFEIVTIRELLSRKTDIVLSRPHRVNFFGIVFYTQGRGVHNIDYIDYQVGRNTLFCISKDQVQSLDISPDTDGYAVLVTEEYLEKSRSYSTVLGDAALFYYQAFSPALPLDDLQAARINELMRHIHNEYRDGGTYALGEMISNYFTVLLLKVMSITEKQVNLKLSPVVYQQFLEFKKNIRDKKFRSRNVNDYAKLMNISTRKLNGITRMVINKTAKKFLDEYITMEAKRLLVQGGAVKQISYELGFDEATNFVKFFKRQTNATPTEFLGGCSA